MRFLSFFAAAALAGCAEGDFTKANSSDNALKDDVTAIVREFANDPSARVTVSSIDDTIVCGTVATRGATKRFYADLVDEEAFIDSGDGAMTLVINTACS
ncbi:MAG: hypothetical protein AAGJ87_06480 [Pseudomonadota bacterium]